MRPEKARLRERFRTARLELTPETRRAAADAIAQHLQTLPAWDAARCVALYWPLLTRGEVDTLPLLHAATAAGKTVALPLVVSTDPPALAFRQLDADLKPEALAMGRWGLREPPATAALVAPEHIELVVVPAFGAGRNGARIGHGGGFYDAFLPTTSAPRVGLVYDACLIDHIPAEPHDAPLDWIVTEREALHVPRNPSLAGT